MTALTVSPIQAEFPYALYGAVACKSVHNAVCAAAQPFPVLNMPICRLNILACFKEKCAYNPVFVNAHIAFSAGNIVMN